MAKRKTEALKTSRVVGAVARPSGRACVFIYWLTAGFVVEIALLIPARVSIRWRSVDQAEFRKSVVSYFSSSLRSLCGLCVSAVSFRGKDSPQSRRERRV